MRFYRLVHKKELEYMMDEDKRFLGVGINQISTQSNTHTYDPRKRYLHFFYNKRACQHILQLYDRKIKYNQDGSVKDYYIISFDIPFYKVFKHLGKGYYRPFKGEIHGYDDDYIVSRIELALNTEEFKKEWISQIEQAYYFYKKPKKDDEKEPNN